MTQASWLRLPEPHRGLVAICLSLFYFGGKSACCQEPTTLHSTFYRFLPPTAICIRVVRKIPIPGGSRFNGKSISIIHVQPEFHTLEALDIILGNQERNSCSIGHTPRDFSLLIQGSRVCRDLLESVKFQPEVGPGRPGNKTDLHPTWVSLCPTCRDNKTGLWLANIIFHDCSTPF